jgi:hypothetical protein
VVRVSTDKAKDTSVVLAEIVRGYKDPLDSDVLSVPLEERALELRKMYGTCEASYILREVYKLPYRVVAKLLGVTMGTVAKCIHRIRLRQQAERTINIPIAGSLTPRDLREACKSSAISVECQMLETEAFMFNVSRVALPASAFWDVFIFAKAAHRVVFSDIYNFFLNLADMDLKKLRRLFRAVKAKDRWYVGDGIVVYTYNLLDKSCFYRGYYNPRLSFNIAVVIEQLTRKDPIGEPLIYLAMAISDKLTWLIKQRKNEIVFTMKEVYATVTRMYDLD